VRTGWDAYPFWGVFAVSLFAFLLPAPSLPSGPDVSDKLEHAAIFLVLAVTGRYASYPAGRLFAGLVGYAVLSEVLQAVLPIGRNGDWHDIVADTLGILCGLLVVQVVTSSLDRLGARDRS
jgi:VanZ family protein